MTAGIYRFDDKMACASSKPAFDPWLLRRMLAGMSPKALAIAGEMSVRTAYRWRSEMVSVEEVTVGGYKATYVLRRTKPPIRVTSWSRT